MSHLKLLIFIFSISILGACKSLPTAEKPTPFSVQNASAQQVVASLDVPTRKVEAPKSEVKSPQKPTAPVTYHNLWDEIGANLKFNTQSHPRLQKRIDWYLQQPTYLTSANRRAEPYLYHIVKRVKQLHLPMELALLPFVESDFRLKARSSEQALGVWQLMPSTAHHFGIKRDEWYEGRLDVLASTDAALAYLKYLHTRFNGDWLHAIAAYNSGEGRVKQAIVKNRKQGKSTHFWHLKLPKETSEYVPKLLALSYLLKTQHGKFKQPFIANRPITTVLDIGQPFDFAVLAKLSGVDKDKLHRLNTGFLQHRSSPKGPQNVLFPFAESALVSKPFFKEHFTLNYRVISGDTLYKIAKNHRMSLDSLRTLNNKQDNLLKVGDTLKVSRPTKKANLLVDYEISPFLAKLNKPKITLADHQHIVASGESLWSISQQYHVSMRDLSDWNKLGRKSLLKLGQILTVKLPRPLSPEPMSSNDPLADLQLKLKQNSQPR
ncbi:transglycosylase SLT domain-containing protein [Pseudoalteromonas xiamenensis]|uniref:transglycosylase SLT domain-containing protein n=1 Tax=Pseudoalteromonas xiamenensis TaxID=882626 RepID=UPI0027E46F2E|nr:transglycosylase SLT domain-containing protein [Pseudoalteromonas xiamenensis]WMN58363.1 transglycosylase SLT domain-containing protein [Pseudoalteromonas xiamenensis]